MYCDQSGSTKTDISSVNGGTNHLGMPLSTPSSSLESTASLESLYWVFTPRVGEIGD